ncbi:YlbF family regulator [Paenibacillaceae bacterium T2]|uniref:YlbF family regulator n=2 Tax=Ferviditalea candida TaxID=3108399 RepID=A0ABU5ZMY5_9BACL|nr:YlbF family regulator [Paenibacillaceae bacterium T2]
MSHPLEEFSVRDLIVRDDILAKTKELADLLSTSDEVETYRKAEKLIQQNGQVQGLISSIKKKQKELVAFETTFKNAQMVEKIENEIKELEEELDRIPIVNQFRQTQDDINYLLQMVVSVIRDTLSEKIAVQAGTEAPPTSCSD